MSAQNPDFADALTLQQSASVAVTMAPGRWEQGGEYRDKLADEQKAAQLE